MAELLSVGLDVGTTTTQLVVSRLTAENRASTFAVPHMEITARQVVYQSPVYFTPLLGVDRVDGEGIRALLAREYRAAGGRVKGPGKRKPEQDRAFAAALEKLLQQTVQG